MKFIQITLLTLIFASCSHSSKNLRLKQIEFESTNDIKTRVEPLKTQNNTLKNDISVTVKDHVKLI